MLNIVICDDDTLFLKTLERKINGYLGKKNIEFSTTKYNSAELLLQSNINQVDIIFLDVNLKDMNGIETAASLRRITQKFILIFVSCFIEYAPAGYQVNALRYVLKDQLDVLLVDALDEAIKKLGFFRSRVSFKFVSGEMSTYTDTIIYIESRLHEVHFHFINSIETHYLYDTLNSIQNMLPNNEFVRIHQSYLVNLKYFFDAKNYRALLKGNIELPISQKLFSKVKKQLFLYRGKISC